MSQTTLPRATRRFLDQFKSKINKDDWDSSGSRLRNSKFECPVCALGTVKGRNPLRYTDAASAVGPELGIGLTKRQIDIIVSAADQRLETLKRWAKSENESYYRAAIAVRRKLLKILDLKEVE